MVHPGEGTNRALVFVWDSTVFQDRPAMELHLPSYTLQLLLAATRTDVFRLEDDRLLLEALRERETGPAG